MARLDDIKAKLAARRGKPGFAENTARLERAVSLLSRRQVPLEQRIKEGSSGN
jgi:exonuclease VII small subunit